MRGISTRLSIIAIVLIFLLTGLGIMISISIMTKKENAHKKKAETATISEWRLIKVLNLEPIDYGTANRKNSLLKYGDVCGIEFGGVVTKLGELDSLHVLVRYVRPNIDEREEACPSRVIFQLSKEEFQKMTADYLDSLQTEQVLRKKIAEILEESKK